MEIKDAFARALRECRKHRGMTQEDFSLVSSRTYLSTLERGLKSPTVEKIQALAEQMEIHPLSLLALTWLYSTNNTTLDALLERVRTELGEIAPARAGSARRKRGAPRGR